MTGPNKMSSWPFFIVFSKKLRYANYTTAEIIYFILVYLLFSNSIFSKSCDIFKVLSFLCHLPLSSCLLVCFFTLVRVRNFKRLFCFTEINVFKDSTWHFVWPGHILQTLHRINYEIRQISTVRLIYCIYFRGSTI